MSEAGLRLAGCNVETASGWIEVEHGRIEGPVIGTTRRSA
jgi:hypothetical protein